jgi:hypothetical protein
LWSLFLYNIANSISTNLHDIWRFFFFFFFFFKENKKTNLKCLTQTIKNLKCIHFKNFSKTKICLKFWKNVDQKIVFIFYCLLSVFLSFKEHCKFLVIVWGYTDTIFSLRNIANCALIWGASAGAELPLPPSRRFFPPF